MERSAGSGAGRRRTARVLLLVGVWGLQACGVLPARGVRDREVRVTAEAPAPSPRPDPFRPLREVLSLSPREAVARWGETAAAAALGDRESRLLLLALAVRLPPDAARRADLDRVFPPTEETGDLDPLERVLLEAARRVPPPAEPPAEPAAVDDGCRRRLAKAVAAAREAESRVRHLEERLRQRDEENRALARQIEELKAIERILEHRRPE